MTVKLFAIDARDSWVHAYEVDVLSVHGMPVTSS